MGDCSDNGVLATALILDPRGRMVSPLEPPLDDAVQILSDQQLTDAVEAPAPTLLQPGAVVDAYGATYPPLDYVHNMGWDAEELGKLARLIPLPHGQGQLDGMLMVKAEDNDAAAVEQLLAAGANPNAGRFPLQPQKGAWEVGGRTSLHLACYEGALAAIPLLLGAGADPNQEDDCGNTAFDVACEAARGGQRTSRPQAIADREHAARLVAPGRELPAVDAVKSKLAAACALAREVGPRRDGRRRAERAASLRAELECAQHPVLLPPAAEPGPDPGGTGLLISPAKDCLWSSHWYVHTARAAKARCGGAVRVGMHWHDPPTAAEQRDWPADEQAADAAAGGWKAR
jgi:hypothetical protein